MFLLWQPWNACIYGLWSMDDEILDSSNDTKDDDESGDDDSDEDDGDDKSDQICISFLDLTRVDILVCLGNHKTFL